MPPDAVVQIAMANEDVSNVSQMGMRETGSSLERVIDLQDAKDGGSNIAALHVNADASSKIEWKHEDIGWNHNFYLLGYWDLSAP